MARFKNRPTTEVLNKQNIDFDSNFFALGGHSLLAVQCLSRLRDKIPVSLSLSDFFDNGTITKQCALITQRLKLEQEREINRSTNGSVEAPSQNPQPQTKSRATTSPVVTRNRTISSPLSPGQRRLWFTEQLNAGAPIFNESEAVRLVGELNLDALQDAVAMIVSRHEILRTTIQAVNQIPVAVVSEDWRPDIKKLV
jgi:hypothetical protein